MSGKTDRDSIGYIDMGERISVPIKEAKYINGAKVTATEIAVKEPGTTAHHEAVHGVVAKKTGANVVGMTIIPGPGYNGLTTLDRPNAIAAAAPHGIGHGGTGHDMRVAGILSDNPDRMAKLGAKIAQQSHEEIIAVASELEDKKTLTDEDVESAMDRAQRQEKEVTITIKKPDGTTETIDKKKSEKGIVVFDSEWVSPKIPAGEEKKSDYDLAV